MIDANQRRSHWIRWFSEVMLAATDSCWNMEREIWNEAISSQKDLVSSVSKSPFRKQKTDGSQGDGTFN